jgi:hypothetical protein
VLLHAIGDVFATILCIQDQHAPEPYLYMKNDGILLLVDQ